MPRHKSKVNNSFEFDEENWVVSILNTGAHSAIVVEGFDGPRPFIGQYDISAATEEEGCVNPNGFISKIGVYENAECLRRGYELCLKSAETKPERGKLYVAKNGNKLEYSVIKPTRGRVGGRLVDVLGMDEITERELAEANLLDIVNAEPFSLDNLKPFLPNILNIIHKKKNAYILKSYEEEKFPAEPRNVSRVKAQAMIALIKRDEERTKLAMENREKMARNVKRLNRIPLTEEELKNFGAANERLHVDRDGNAIVPIEYQYLSENHPLVKLKKRFGNPAAGINCTEWCLRKLAIAGYDNIPTKAKPYWATLSPTTRKAIKATAVIGGVVTLFGIGYAVRRQQSALPQAHCSLPSSTTSIKI